VWAQAARGTPCPTQIDLASKVVHPGPGLGMMRQRTRVWDLRVRHEQDVRWVRRTESPRRHAELATQKLAVTLAGEGRTTHSPLCTSGLRGRPSAPSEDVEKHSYLSPDDEHHQAQAQRGDEWIRREQHALYESPTFTPESQRAPLEERHVGCVNGGDGTRQRRRVAKYQDGN
jgi:hypothetical protein